MTLAEYIAMMSKTPRSGQKPDAASPMQKGRGFYPRTESDVSADSVGSLRLLSLLRDVQQQPRVETATLPSGIEGRTFWPPDNTQTDVQLGSDVPASPARWSTLNHELGHYMESRDILRPFYPQLYLGQPPVSDYAKTNPYEYRAEGLTAALRKGAQ